MRAAWVKTILPATSTPFVQNPLVGPILDFVGSKFNVSTALFRVSLISFR